MSLPPAKAAVKEQFPNVNWQRLRELGYTHDPREAGYIHPNGGLIDFSGKRAALSLGCGALTIEKRAA